MRTDRQRCVTGCLLAAALALFAGCSGDDPPPEPRPPADGVTTQRIGPREVDLTVPSEAVGADVQVRLLLPEGFDREPDRRWPVLYLLHGCCDSYDSWTRSTDIEALSARDDVLVVMPDGDPVGFYSDWLEGPGWEQFHVRELGRVLGERYRAGDARAIAGLSMGGLGAMGYAARNPGTFRAAASFSGLLDTQLDRATSDGIVGLVDSQGENGLDLWGDPRADAAVWREHNPAALASELRGVRLFVSSGNGRAGKLDPPDTPADLIEPGVLAQTRSFLERLRRRHIPVEADLYGNGTHSWPYWERELHRSWPMLMRAVGA